MAKKFTKLIPENQCSGGAEPDRDFYYLGGNINNSVDGTSQALPIINLHYREKGNTNLHVIKFSPNAVGEFNCFNRVPKGCEVRFKFYTTSTQASSFEYFRSEKLGFNITSVTPSADNQTDWVELNEDVFDVEAYAHVTHDTGGAN